MTRAQAQPHAPSPVLRCAAALLAGTLLAAPIGTARAHAGPASSRPAAPQSPPGATTREAAPAESPEATEGRALFREGSRLYDLGQYPKAIERFDRAYQLLQEPLFLFNLGHAHWKWFDVDPKIEHLYEARKLFFNYDRIMQRNEGYDSAEVTGFLATIDRQIAAEQQRIETALITQEKRQSAAKEQAMLQEVKAKEEAHRRALEANEQALEQRLLAERRRRTTAVYKISGNVLITVGSLMAGVGLGGLTARYTSKALLDTSTTSGGLNTASAADDHKWRDTYLAAGQTAFAGFVVAAILLPVGITLRVIATVRERREEGRAHKGVRARLGGGPSAISLSF